MSCGEHALMPSVPTVYAGDVLAATALEAAGGGTLLTIDAERSRPGCAEATVLRGETLLRVTLDADLGTAVVAPALLAVSPRADPAPPSRRCVPALR